MDFIFNTREEFKKFVKLWGNAPQNYKILEDNNNTEATNTNTTHTEEQETKTQYYNIQEPTTPEEAQPPTPTREEQQKILKDYLNTAEIIPEEEYIKIQQTLNPEPPEDAPNFRGKRRRRNTRTRRHSI